jgi:Asp-tRNA(Asn)/Glu-tRNA(Gln) amidotransferase A subunit family amidase
MARTIRGVALGYSILKGPDGIDGYAIRPRDAEADGGGLAGQPIRAGWVSDAAFAPVDPEITAAVAAAASHPADLGCAVEEVTLPFLGDPFGALAPLVYGEIAPSIKALAAGRETWPFMWLFLRCRSVVARDATWRRCRGARPLLCLCRSAGKFPVDRRRPQQCSQRVH